MNYETIKPIIAQLRRAEASKLPAYEGITLEYETVTCAPDHEIKYETTADLVHYRNADGKKLSVVEAATQIARGRFKEEAAYQDRLTSEMWELMEAAKDGQTSYGPIRIIYSNTMGLPYYFAHDDKKVSVKEAAAIILKEDE